MRRAPSNSSVATLIDDGGALVDLGHFPRRRNGSIDLYRIERILRLDIGTADRVAILKRLLDAREKP